jgi:antitoxin (DNA-binding transcriptional repressor) of toxin-antitoxin stability system
MNEKGAARMRAVTVQEAQARLPDLIHQLVPGDELVIIENNLPIAKLVASPAEKPHPVPGRCKEMLTILAEDDDQIEHFKEYTS